MDRITITREQVAAAYDQVDRNIQGILNNKSLKDRKGYDAFFELAYLTDGVQAAFMSISANWPTVCDWCHEEEKNRRYFEP